MSLIARVDSKVQGRGYAIAQAKVPRKDGTVEYHFSRPNLKPWDLLGWVWYLAHKRDIKRARS